MKVNFFSYAFYPASRHDLKIIALLCFRRIVSLQHQLFVMYGGMSREIEDFRPWIGSFWGIDIHDALCYKVANDAMRHDCTHY